MFASMKIFTIVVLFWSFAIIAYGLLLVTESFKPQPSKVLAVQAEVIISSPTTSPSPTLTFTPIPTPTSIPTPTLTPIPTPIPQPEFTSEQINSFIDRFAGQYGVDPHVIRRIAICESGFRPKAINGKYHGLFQFDAITWQNNRKLFGEDPSLDLRLNAEEAVQTAAYMFSVGKGGVWPNCNP